jgi:hypothetical protein
MTTQGDLIYDLNNIDSTANIKSINTFTTNKDIIIPKNIFVKVDGQEEPKKYDVISIGDGAFKNSNFITITFESDSLLKSIGNNAFNQSKIKSIVIPKSVTSIGDSAFSESELTTITFEPNSLLKIIDKSAFSNIEIKSIVIPKGVTSIGDRAFIYSSLKSITFEKDSSLKTIGESAFYESKIKSIVIPKNVSSIGDNAFNKSSLKSIIFKGSKPNFGTKVFDDIGNSLNHSFGYINKPDNSWKGINHINDLIIRNTSYYSKSIISIIICLILLFMLYTSNISVRYKYSLYIMIIISSLILNKQLNTNFIFPDIILAVLIIIFILLPFLLFFIVLIPIYPLLKMLLFGFFGFTYFVFMIVNHFISFF